MGLVACSSQVLSAPVRWGEGEVDEAVTLVEVEEGDLGLEPLGGGESGGFLE